MMSQKKEVVPSIEKDHSKALFPPFCSGVIREYQVTSRQFSPLTSPDYLFLFIHLYFLVSCFVLFYSLVIFPLIWGSRFLNLTSSVLSAKRAFKCLSPQVFLWVWIKCHSLFECLVASICNFVPYKGVFVWGLLFITCKLKFLPFPGTLLSTLCTVFSSP